MLSKRNICTCIFCFFVCSCAGLAKESNNSAEQEDSGFVLTGQDVLALCEQENATNEKLVENRCAVFLMGVFQGHAGTVALQSEFEMAREKAVPLEAVRIAADMDDAVHSQLNQIMKDRAVVCPVKTDRIIALIPSIVDRLKSNDELLMARAYYSVIRVLHSLRPCSD